MPISHRTTFHFRCSLIQTSAREFLFCLEFFSIKEASSLKFFGEVMGKSMGLLLKHEEMRVAGWFDAISLVICCRILDEYEKKLDAQNIPCLKPYFQRLTGLLWPRFKYIVDLHAQSVATVDQAKLGKIDSRPHYVVRRYAEFSGGLLKLQAAGVASAEVSAGLTALREEVANFILRMASSFPERKEQLVFQINNYDMMIGVYGTKAGSDEATEFDSLLQARIKEFADEELGPPFGGILKFVKEIERAAERAGKEGTAGPPVQETRVQGLVTGFAGGWKPAVAKINGNVMVSFTNFENGTAILQRVLTELVLLYDRFLAILKAPPFKRPGGWPDMIDRHHVMLEVKKHAVLI